MQRELDQSRMSDRQRRYRDTYRQRIVGWYNGWLHVTVIYAIGFAAMTIYFQSMTDVRWYELLIVPVAFLGANFFEWFLHTHIMHRPQKNRALRAIYMRHTMMHHQFFTDDEMRFVGQHDWLVTFLPPFALVTFICISIPIAIVPGCALVILALSINLLGDFLRDALNPRLK